MLHPLGQAFPENEQTVTPFISTGIPPAPAQPAADASMLSLGSVVNKNANITNFESAGLENTLFSDFFIMTFDSGRATKFYV